MPHKSNHTHKAHGVQNQLHTLQWEVLEHSAYNPHDFHIICHERKPSKAVQACYTTVYRRLSYGNLGSSQIKFAEDGMYQLMHQCKSCLKAGSDFLFFKLL